MNRRQARRRRQASKRCVSGGFSRRIHKFIGVGHEKDFSPRDLVRFPRWRSCCSTLRKLYFLAGGGSRNRSSTWLRGRAGGAASRRGARAEDITAQRCEQKV